MIISLRNYFSFKRKKSILKLMIFNLFCLLYLWIFANEASIFASVSKLSAKNEKRNPFGIMLPSQLLRQPHGINVAKELGAVYFRPASIFLNKWDGTCWECDVARDIGLKLVLTVRNNGPLPTTPPKDLNIYKRLIAQVLEKYHPAILVVENEENSGLFYTGTPEDYGAQLKIACEVAHQKNIPCTNGGLVSALVALLVYEQYLDIGDKAAAEDFANRAFSNKLRRSLASPKYREQVKKGKALLNVYKEANIDYVNFHWYISDTKALQEAVAYLRMQTGLPVITNEVGQYTDSPNQTVAIMKKILELDLPIAVWFGLDGPKTYGLVSKDGTIRSTGKAFKDFIQQSFTNSLR